MGLDDEVHLDGGDGCGKAGVPVAAVPCSICLDFVADDGSRSWAKLQCGHRFHLDCIGSAFNDKGAMQCPNCRNTEKGQWLYATGSCPAHDSSMDDSAHDNDDSYDLSDAEMQEQYHEVSQSWGPTQPSASQGATSMPIEQQISAGFLKIIALLISHLRDDRVDTRREVHEEMSKLEDHLLAEIRRLVEQHLRLEEQYLENQHKIENELRRLEEQRLEDKNKFEIDIRRFREEHLEERRESEKQSRNLEDTFVKLAESMTQFINMAIGQHIPTIQLPDAGTGLQRLEEQCLEGKTEAEKKSGKLEEVVAKLHESMERFIIMHQMRQRTPASRPLNASSTQPSHRTEDPPANA